MCSGIALAVSELPEELFARPELAERVHDRGGEREVRFLYRSHAPCLPVWHEGKLQLVQWGGTKQNRALPKTGWALLADVEKGQWQSFCPEFVDIPATAGLEKGIWFRVQQGMRGLLITQDSRGPVVYMLCEPASHYYTIMTRSQRMPVLIGERI